MSGLQEITAIFAVVELGVKSLSAVYDLIQTLRHIPTRIEQAKHEVRDILKCLAGLRFIQTTDSATIHAIDRAGLEASVSSCRKACDELRVLLSTWDPRQSSIAAKLKYFRHRKAFDGLLNDITNRKQNTALALGITQLSLQASSQQATISHFKNLERLMAHRQHPSRHGMAEQTRTEDSGFYLESERRGNSWALNGRNSSNTAGGPHSAFRMSSGRPNQVAPYTGLNGRTTAEHEDTNTEGPVRERHSAHVFTTSVVHAYQQVKQKFKGVNFGNKANGNGVGTRGQIQNTISQEFSGDVKFGDDAKQNFVGASNK